MSKSYEELAKKLRRGSPATFFETFAVHCCVFVTFLASLRNFFCEDDPRKLRTRPCKKRTKSKALPPQKSYEELCQKLRKALAFRFEWKTLHKKLRRQPKTGTLTRYQSQGQQEKSCEESS